KILFAVLLVGHRRCLSACRKLILPHRLAGLAKSASRMPSSQQERLLAGLPDVRRLAEFFGHLEMVFEGRKRLASPVLEIGVIAALGIAFEQRNRVLVGADLIGVEIRAEILARGILQLVELALVRTVDGCRQLGLDLAAVDESLQIVAGL